MSELLLVGLLLAAGWWWSKREDKASAIPPPNPLPPPEPAAAVRQSSPTGQASPPAPPPVAIPTPVARAAAPSILRPRAAPFAFCALDTETTGIVPKSRRHRAFEIACVRFTPRGPDTWAKARFTRYVRVDTAPMAGLKLSAMWQDHVARGGQREAVKAAAALDALRDFIGDLPVVCHNAAFDRAVIENEIEKTGHRWRPSNSWICTLLMARESRLGTYVGVAPGRPDGMSYKLEHVAAALNLPLDPSKLHLGHYDAEIAGTAFLKMHHLRGAPLRTL